MTIVQDMSHTFRTQSGAMAIWRDHGLFGLLQYIGIPLEDVLSPANGICCSTCIDERIGLRPHLRGAQRIAGGGLLLGMHRAQELWLANNVALVQAHECCGAAALYARKCGYEMSQLEADTFAFNTLKAWAEEVMLPCEIIRASSLKRQTDFHSARGIVIDSTGRLNLTANLQLPDMFVITANAEPEEIMSDVSLSWDIANGPHGLGKFITDREPFLITRLQKSGELASPLNELLQEFTVRHGGRVLVQTARIR